MSMPIFRAPPAMVPSAMTRERLLALLKELECAAEAYNAGYSCAELKAAIEWLEKMPDGVSLHCSDWWKRGYAGPPREPVR